MGARLLWRILHEATLRPTSGRPALILGAGNAGVVPGHQHAGRPQLPVRPRGPARRRPGKRHVRLGGVPVLGTRKVLSAAVEQTEAEVLVIAIPSARSELFRDVADSARGLGLQVRVPPTLHDILNGTVNLRDLRDIDITDLLGREPVDTDVAASAGYLTGKRVLVTGAGGSTASACAASWLVGFAPAGLYMLDRDESALQALQLSLVGHGLLDTEDVVLADAWPYRAAKPRA